MKRWIAFGVVVTAGVAGLWILDGFLWALALVASVIAIVAHYRQPVAGLSVWKIEALGYGFCVVARSQEDALDILARKRLGPDKTGYDWVTQVQEESGRAREVRFDVTTVSPNMSITSEDGVTMSAARWSRALPNGGYVTEV